jgi:hypothetical protein
VLTESLEAVLTPDGQPPPDGSVPRVKVHQITSGPHPKLTVSWTILPTDDGSIPVEQAYQDAADLLRVIKGFDGLRFDRIYVRGLYPVDTDNDVSTPREVKRVILLRFTKPRLDSIDFDTLEPLDLPDKASSADIDPDFSPTTTTTTTSTSSTSSSAPSSSTPTT